MGSRPSLTGYPYPWLGAMIPFEERHNAPEIDSAERWVTIRNMPSLIENPTIIAAAGTKPKRIEEYVGRVSCGEDKLSVARMVSPGGWREPGQCPEFREISVVLRGLLRVEHAGGILDVRAGQAVVADPAEWVRYSTPEPDGSYKWYCLRVPPEVTTAREAIAWTFGVPEQEYEPDKET